MQLVTVGTSSHVPTAARDTTSLLIRPAAGSPVLVEAPGSVVRKLHTLGVDPRALEHVILTHDHTDHVYGFPHLVHSLWQHSGTLHVHAPPRTVETARRLLEVLGLGGEDYPEIRFHAVEPSDRPQLLIEHAGVVIQGVASDHPRPTFALRVDEPASGHSFVHSSDTRPCAAITALAHGAHTLLHDCAVPHRFFDLVGRYHSTAREAGEVATRAGVERLVLMHLHSTLGFADDELLADARTTFAGDVVVPRDGETLDFPVHEPG